MSTLAVTNALASVLVPIGNAGAVIAVICALLTAFALARGAAGLAGGGIGVWILGALLSLCASFVMSWTPFFISAAALAGAFVVGALGRVLARAATRARDARQSVATAATETVAAVPAEAPKAAAPRTPARGIPSRAVTETVRIAS